MNIACHIYFKETPISRLYGALFLSHIYKEQTLVDFETDARNLNDVLSHIRQQRV